jgi:hypothetical protein
MNASKWQFFMAPLTKKRRVRIDIIDPNQVTAEINTFSVKDEACPYTGRRSGVMPNSKKSSKKVLT